MRVRSGRAMLAAVVVLSVIVLATAETGPLPGLYFGGEEVLFNLLGFFFGRTTVTTTDTTFTSTATNATSGTGSGGHVTGSGGTTQTTQTAPLVYAPQSQFLWTVLAPVVIVVVVALLYFATRGQAGGLAVDLSNDLMEMEDQRAYLLSLSSKLRNRALLRYYVLLVRVCGEAAIVDGPAETPQEFVSRASERLGLDPQEAAKFARAVDLARYGPELSDADAQQAAGFMTAFTETVRGRVQVG